MTKLEMQTFLYFGGKYTKSGSSAITGVTFRPKQPLKPNLGFWGD